jgi:hypothetical protein
MTANCVADAVFAPRLLGLLPMLLKGAAPAAAKLVERLSCQRRQLFSLCL